MGRERDLTTGSILKNIIYFSVPFLLSYFLQTLYGLADLFIIGQYCDVSATTAVSIGGQLMHVLTVVIVGLSMGSTVLIGKAVGGHQTEEKNQLVGNTATLFLLLSVVLTIVLQISVNGIIDVMRTPVEAVEETTTYLRICFIGVPLITSYNIISSIYRGMGDSKSPMYFVAIACVTNIVLDYWLIGHESMGAKGAAYATVTAQGVSVAIALAYTIIRKSIEGIGRQHFKMKKSVTKKILRIGLPVSAQDAFIQFSFILITIFANQRGLNDAAAVGIVEKLIGIMFLIPSSLLSSVSTLCAQNNGAGKHDRARKTLLQSALIASGFGLAFGISYQFISEWNVGLFTHNADVVRLGGQYLQSYVWDCLFAGIHFCFSGYFCAYGRSEISFIHNVISIITARVPLAYLASVHYADTLYPMGWAAPIGSLISILVCIYFYRKLSKTGVFK